MLAKELREARGQLEETERLLGVAQTEESIIEEIEVPKARKIDVDKLFKREGREGREGLSLEEQLKRLPVEERRDVERLAKEPIEDVYARIKSFTEIATQYEREQERIGPTYEAISREELDRRREIYELALREKRRAEETGEYKIDEKKEHLMTAAEKLTYRRL